MRLIDRLREKGLSSGLGLFGVFLYLISFFLPVSTLCVYRGGCEAISRFDMLMTDPFAIFFLVPLIIAVVSSLFLKGKRRAVLLVLSGLFVLPLPLLEVINRLSSPLGFSHLPVTIVALVSGVLFVLGGLMEFFR